ncbi:MAG: AAA family ATPase [Desulfuromonadales bacterium]|nr:AAA family ATPase [Desulfuromonadales bacterium]
MYKEYFGFKEDPFTIAPDPQFLYMSEKHREALAHMLYGMKADSGFVLLTGAVGTGKTTVCRCLLNHIPENSEVAFILNPKLSVVELLATICDELGIGYPPETSSIKVFVDRLNLFLLDAHSRDKRVILIIDEAQNLSVEVLEQIRLLTNLETDKRKLLQVILLGQPELNRLLERPDLRQLAQRVTARYHLEPLSRSQLPAYLAYRLAKAGVERPLFSSTATDRLYRLSGGVPRVINLICDRALLGAYGRGEHQVSAKLLTQAAGEILGRNQQQRSREKWLFSFLLIVMVVVVGALIFLLMPAPRQENLVRIPVHSLQEHLSQEEAPREDLQLTEVPMMENPADFFISRPAGLSTVQSRALAMQTLSALWGYPGVFAEDTTMPPGHSHGLVVLEGEGDLSRLRTLNHPAVLMLRDLHGNDGFYATLSALDETMATLIVGTDLVRVPVDVLHGQWSGDFTLLWQPPPGYQGVLRAGDEGITMFWLEQQMAKLNGRAIREMADLMFDQVLVNEVRTLQHQHNLNPDGLVGPHTLMLINSRHAIDQPRLNAYGEQ